MRLDAFHKQVVQLRIRSSDKLSPTTDCGIVANASGRKPLGQPVDEELFPELRLTSEELGQKIF